MTGGENQIPSALLLLVGCQAWNFFSNDLNGLNGPWKILSIFAGGVLKFWYSHHPAIERWGFPWQTTHFGVHLWKSLADFTFFCCSVSQIGSENTANFERPLGCQDQYARNRHT